MQVYAWGNNRYHQLGVSALPEQRRVVFGDPLLSRNLEHLDLLDVKCGTFHSLALDKDGRVYSFGKSEAFLGLSSSRVHSASSSSAVARSLQSPSNLDTPAATTTINNAGRAYSHITTLPTQVRGELESRIVAKIFVGDSASAAVTAEGELFEWGLIHSAQDGEGSRQGEMTNELPGLAGQDRNRAVPMSDRLRALLRASTVEYLTNTHRARRRPQRERRIPPEPRQGEEEEQEQEEESEDDSQLQSQWDAEAIDAEAGIIRMSTRRKPVYAPLFAEVPDRLFVHDVAMGFCHTLIVAGPRRKLFAKGYADRGQTGRGTRVNSVRFEPVLGIFDDPTRAGDVVVRSIASGNSHNLVCLTNGEGWSFGSNVLGSLGVGDLPDQLLPVRINLPGKRIALVRAGNFHSAVLTEDGELYAFGHSEYNQHASEEEAGDYRHLNRYFFVPRPVYPFAATETETGETRPAAVKLVSLECGDQFTTGIDDKGIVWIWGWSASGVVPRSRGLRGLGSRPQRVEALIGKNVERVSAGGQSVFALTKRIGYQYASSFRALMFAPPSTVDDLSSSSSRRGGIDDGRPSSSTNFFDLRLANTTGEFVLAHRCIVYARCPALHALAVAQKKTDGTNVPPLLATVCLPLEINVLRALVEYLYLDDVTSVPPHRIVDLRKQASALGLHRLVTICDVLRYHRNVMQGLEWAGSLSSSEPAAQDVTQTTLPAIGKIPESTFARDLQTLLESEMGRETSDVCLEIESDEEDDTPPVPETVPMGHTAFTWNTSAPLPRMGHTPFSWGGNEETRRSSSSTNENKKTNVIEAHRCIISRYEYFRLMLQGGFAESEARTIRLQDPTFRPELMSFVYGGEESLLRADNVADLLCSASLFQLEDLMRACERFLLAAVMGEGVLDAEDLLDLRELAEAHGLSKLERIASLKVEAMKR